MSNLLLLSQLVLQMSSLFSLPGAVNLVKFRELLHRLWVLTASHAWLLVSIQRKRRRSLTAGNGSGVSVCPPVVTVAWGHARALALELSANKPPRLRSVRFPATGRSNLEVSIALLRDLLCFYFKYGAGSLYFLLRSANVLVKQLVLCFRFVRTRTREASEGSFLRAPLQRVLITYLL